MLLDNSLNSGKPDSALAVVKELQAPIDFYDLTQDQLALILQERFGQPKFRAKQLFSWVYQKGITDLSLMTDIAKTQRAQLEGVFSFVPLTTKSRLISQDGTRKYLFEVEQGHLIESVMIKQPKRMTLCVSSQVGCAMGCTFCRTASMGLTRNLKASEIVRQIIAVTEDAKNFGDMFQNIVFMGMGEPLHNFKEVHRALSIMKSEPGLAISGRRVTVSTSGLVPGIEKLGACGIEVNLAVSLNATTDDLRKQIMPVTKSFSLEKLLTALKAYPMKPRKRITIEYVMLSGVNDTDADLKRLPQLLKGIRCKINLIPYNEGSGLDYRSPTEEKLKLWQDKLLQSGVETTIRWSKGQDILAACGQLKAAVETPITSRQPSVPISS